MKTFEELLTELKELYYKKTHDYVGEERKEYEEGYLRGFERGYLCGQKKKEVK